MRTYTPLSAQEAVESNGGRQKRYILDGEMGGRGMETKNIKKKTKPTIIIKRKTSIVNIEILKLSDRTMAFVCLPKASSSVHENLRKFDVGERDELLLTSVLVVVVVVGDGGLAAADGWRVCDAARRGGERHAETAAAAACGRRGRLHQQHGLGLAVGQCAATMMTIVMMVIAVTGGAARVGTAVGADLLVDEIEHLLILLRVVLELIGALQALAQLVERFLLELVDDAHAVVLLLQQQQLFVVVASGGELNVRRRRARHRAVRGALGQLGAEEHAEAGVDRVLLLLLLLIEHRERRRRSLAANVAVAVAIE